MDPITLAIVAALVGGLAGGIAEGAVGSAYNALKEALKKKHGENSKIVQAINAVEEEPDFKPNQETLAGRVEQVHAVQDPELLALAQQLVAALEKTAAGQQALSNYHIEVKDSQVGVIGPNAKVTGGIHLGGKK